jgi:hypothetical protein
MRCDLTKPCFLKHKKFLPHESGRGVEDISSMARAMYGQDYFDRFSPDVLCRTLSPSAR